MRRWGRSLINTQPCLLCPTPNSDGGLDGRVLLSSLRSEAPHHAGHDFVVAVQGPELGTWPPTAVLPRPVEVRLHPVTSVCLSSCCSLLRSVSLSLLSSLCTMIRCMVFSFNFLLHLIEAFCIFVQTALGFGDFQERNMWGRQLDVCFEVMSHHIIILEMWDFYIFILGSVTCHPPFNTLSLSLLLSLSLSLSLSHTLTHTFV